MTKEEKIRELLRKKEILTDFRQELTGYPSKDMPWLRYYDIGAYERATNIPQGKTVWDVIEEKLKEYYDIPAIEYFKRQISRPEFINNVYTWARTFRAMGVEPDEVVPIYGPFFPDICAMTFALNAIGACPYFLKLAISPNALEEETRDSKVAVVYDGMWKNVASEFSKDKFKTVVVATATDAMPSPKKEVLSFLSYIQTKKDKSGIPDEKKYVWVDKAKDIANYYTGEVKVPFVPNRNAFITSSSGTTIGGIVKGVVATNESTLYQIFAENETIPSYHPGDRCLTNFPPTASTSLNCLFILPMFKGCTVVNDPRVSEKDFYNQIITLKPNIIFTTGSMWETFFNKIEKDLNNNKKYNFDFADGWVVGGEGIDPRKFDKWVELLKKCNAPEVLYSGYGSSEFFAVVSGDVIPSMSNTDLNRKVLGVGIPYAGINLGIHDEYGEELKYNQRGELWISGSSRMKEYYNKPELTKKTIVNGCIRSGDVASIDENGYLYIYGRISDKIKEDLYTFDIASKIKENEYIDDAMIIPLNLQNCILYTAHIVWKPNISEEIKNEQLILIDDKLKEFLPDDVIISAYKEYQNMLPYSSTTLKKDKNGMANQLEGYKYIIDGEVKNINFSFNKNGNYDIIFQDKQSVKRLKKQ